MDKSVIINLVIAVLCAAIYGAKVYFQTRGSVFEAASKLIAEIESSGLIGKEKMAFVVGKLVELIPIPLKSVFTLERLETLAQEVFDNMKQYALEYAKRIDDKNAEKEDQEKPEAPAEEPVEEPVEKPEE